MDKEDQYSDLGGVVESLKKGCIFMFSLHATGNYGDMTKEIAQWRLARYLDGSLNGLSPGGLYCVKFRVECEDEEWEKIKILAGLMS